MSIRKSVKKFWMSYQARNKRVIHFLHIGKNAGTEVKRYIKFLNPLLPDSYLIGHGHDVFLKNISVEQDYFFSIRDPISRFRSGFYSRKRKGQPLTYAEWSKHDAIAFEDFEHANDLAEALFREDEIGIKAISAIKSIRHTAQNQVDWFQVCGNFLRVKPPIAVLRQEHFDQDILFLQRKLGVSEPTLLPSDEVRSHKNSYSRTPDLSQLAISNLKRWYAQDLEFYKLCSHWISENQEDHRV
jgi:hypothetical protein